MTADAGTQNVIVPVNLAGPVYIESSTASKYYLRFRIVSDDGIKYSKWSQNFSVNYSNVVASAGFQTLGHTFFSDASTISIAWHLKENVYAAGFDVYARWNDDATKPTTSDSSWTAWQFISEADSSGASIIIPTTPLPSPPTKPKWVQIHIQLRSFPKIISNDIKILETDVYSTRATINSGLVTEL